MTDDFLKSYQSVEWQKKRNTILERDNYTCALCGSHGEDGSLMHVHHLTYAHCKNGKAWDCPDEDLVTLCDKCHKEVHSNDYYGNTPSIRFHNIYISNRAKHFHGLVFYSKDGCQIKVEKSKDQILINGKTFEQYLHSVSEQYVRENWKCNAKESSKKTDTLRHPVTFHLKNIGMTFDDLRRKPKKDIANKK